MFVLIQHVSQDVHSPRYVHAFKVPFLYKIFQENEDFSV